MKPRWDMIILKERSFYFSAMKTLNKNKIKHIHNNKTLQVRKHITHAKHYRVMSL